MKYLITILLMLTACTRETSEIAETYIEPTIDVKPLYEAPVTAEQVLSGVASYYDYVLDSGWSSVGHYVCATRDFERYSYVIATNVANGKSVVCKITDYGPNEDIFPDRIIDLSSTAFKDIASTKLGVVNVTVEPYDL